MPAKTKKESVQLETPSVGKREILSSPDSYKSLFYGIATVLVLFVLAIGVVKLFLAHPKGEIDNKAVSVSNITQAMEDAKKGVYTVQTGDSLWSIAEDKYKDGFKWGEIARANNITNPSEIEEGMKITIPKISETAKQLQEDQTSMTQSNSPNAPAMNQTQSVSSLEKITGTSYTIHHGDDLWEIAVRAYGDGYRWIDIAQANNLSDPNLIHGDNKLVLPR